MKIIIASLKTFFLACGLACLAAVTCLAQRAEAPARPAANGAAQISLADGASLAGRIKRVDSPAFRAYLHTRLAAWLWQSAGGDEAVRRAAAEAAAAGIADIHAHEQEIPPAPAGRYYADLLSIVRRHNAEEAERLRQEFPLRAHAQQTEADKAGASLSAALSKLEDPRNNGEGLEQAVRLIKTGRVPVMTLHGAILGLDQAKSAALPEVLSAALALEEQNTGAIPLQNLFFLSHLYLRDTTPAELQARFLAAAVKATGVNPAELRADPSALSWAAQLLQRSLPRLQKLSPELHAEAAARLAAISSPASPDEAIYSRIRNSADPLAETVNEAAVTKDERLRNDLLASAARLAKQAGKLRQAVELMASTKEDRRDLPEHFSPRDEFLDAVVQSALEQQDVETARLASSHVTLPHNRALALRRLARHFVRQKDKQSAAESLEEAARRLKDAPEGKEKAAGYFRLAADFAELNEARAAQLLREAVKAADNIARPAEDPGGKFSWALFPLADEASKTFRQLARKDRTVALHLADTFLHTEFKVAATLAVYSSAQE